MKPTLLLAVVALAGTLHAQDASKMDFPFRPLPTVRVRLSCPKTPDAICQDVYHRQPGEHWQEPLPVRRRTADGKYIGLTAASLGLTILDVQHSTYAIGDCQRVRETNPLYGKCPGVGRYYAIALPIFAATSYFSYKWKREDEALKDASIRPHRGWQDWRVPQIVNGVSHLVGILVTVGSTGK